MQCLIGSAISSPEWSQFRVEIGCHGNVNIVGTSRERMFQNAVDKLNRLFSCCMNEKFFFSVSFFFLKKIKVSSFIL